MSRLPPLNALRAFEAAGRHLTFRAAAEELGVTQGAVAQQVRALESRLGMRLFDRLPRGLALTDAGRRYHAPVRRAFALLEEATAELGQGRTVLTISVPPSFAQKWLVPRLGAFTRANPDLDVRVAGSERLANFQNDGIDIAVRLGKAPFGPGLRADLLFSAVYAPVCAPALADGNPPLRTPHDLRSHVLLQDAHGLWPLYFERHLGAPPSPGQRIVKFNQTSLSIDAAIGGQGVALACAPLVADDIAQGRLVRPLSRTIEDGTGFYIVAPRAPRRAKAVQRMRDWLLAQASE